MSTADLNNDLQNAIGGPRIRENADRIYNTLCRGFDLPVTPIGDGQSGVPISRVKQAWYESHRQTQNTGEQSTLERLYGTRHPFMAMLAAGPQYQDGDSSVRQVEEVLSHRSSAPEDTRAAIDQSVVGAASPIEVDPMIVDIQRSAAPVLDIIAAQAQAGFTAQYNVFDGRTLGGGYMSEAEAIDLSSNTDADFSLNTDEKDMSIMAETVNISDFSQRAEASLGYMDLMSTTLGQVMTEIFLRKAKGYFYGDTSVNAGDQSVEDADAFDGLAKMADDASNSTDKSTVSSGFLDDLLDVVTSKVENTGLTWDRARILCSQSFYNAVYKESTPVVRIDGYDAPVEYGPRGIAIGTENGTVQISPCPNIRNYAGLTGVGAGSDNGDVFLIDEAAVQWRQLAPMSTVPLGRVGLADRAALFEYGTLVDKSQGNHLEWLQGYDITV